MKIAIQTLYLTNNYGGVLQAFALQRYLENQGHEVVHLNRKPIPRDPILRIKLFLYPFVHYKRSLVERRINRNFKNFIKKYINLSPELKSKEKWDEFVFDNKFEVLIAGSDQIWRSLYNVLFVEESFLQYEKSTVKKIAYAASFGTSEDVGYSDYQLKKFLSGFDAISVREDDALSLVKKYYEGDIFHLIDPTLLLKREDYINIFQLDQHMFSDSILVYLLDENEDKRNLLQICNDISGRDLDMMYGSIQEDADYRNFDFAKKPEIEVWLQKFLSTPFVITDSFHGVVFSLIFNKPFIALGNIQRGLARFKSILKMFNLENRLILSRQDLNQELFDQKIDWKKINSIIKKRQNDSEEFFTMIFNI